MRSISNIKDASLFVKLMKEENREVGDFAPLTNSIYMIEEEVSEKLTMVPTYMREYTLHDIKHCVNILNIIDKILPENINLNLIELYLIILATLLHDVGMAPSEEVVRELLNSKEYEEFKERNETIPQNQLISEFIRNNHVKYSIDYVKYLCDMNKLNKYQGVDLSRWIKSIIKGHGLSVAEIAQDEESFPMEKLIGDFNVNVNFLALLLRLGDVLDFDNSRTPEVLYSHIAPKNKVSMEEWEKHLSVSGKSISPNFIKYDINSSNIKIERKVRNFIKYIEEEIVNTNNFLKKQDSEYKLQLSNEVTLNVSREGYIYNSLELQIYYDNIVNILMGTHLYDNPYIFLRELIQNSYDACNYRKVLMNELGDLYEPLISIKYNTNTYELSIEDNGYGIDEEIFKEYVIKIGKSFFGEKRLKNNTKFKPISKFGIGLLSNFMVSDTIIVESRRYSTPDEIKETIYYEMNIGDTYINQKKSNRVKVGTKIILKINDIYNSQLKDKQLLKIIRQNMVCQDIPIKVSIDNNEFIINDTIDKIIDKYKGMNDVIFIEINDICGVEGGILLVKNISYSTAPDSLIGYKGFKIKNGRESLINIEWLSSNYSIFLNIDDPIELDLNASRDRFILDENLKELRQRITKKLLSEMEVKLHEVSLFISQRADLKLYNYPKEIIGFLWSHIKCKEYNVLSGTVEVKSIEDSISYILKNGGKFIMIEEEMLNEGDNLEQISKEVCGYNIILTETNHKGYIRQFIDPLMKSNLKVISEVKGCVYSKIQLNTDKNLETIEYDQNNMLTYNRFNNIEFEDENIFMVIDNIEDIVLAVNYSKNNSLAILLEENKNTLSVKKFRDLFEVNLINHMFSNGEKLRSLNRDIKDHIYSLAYKSDYFKKTINFIGKEFLNEINKYIEDELIKELEKETNIKVENIDDYMIKFESFPKWYWEE